MCAGSGAPGQLMGLVPARRLPATPSIGELYVGICGPLPTDVVFTWARAKKLLGIG